MNLQKMNDALNSLCAKYSVQNSGVISGTECKSTLNFNGKEIPLLVWRTERRFNELKNFTLNGTLEDISTFRFANFICGGCLKGLLKKELDLAVWLSGRKLLSVFAVKGGETAVNVIAKLEGGLNVSIECGTGLPQIPAEPMDRHEIIASRGVASDRVVDTQVPQSSVYLFNQQGANRFTDTDAELFGFTLDEVLVIRAAFAVLQKPELSAEWLAADAAADAAAQGAFDSDAARKVICFA